MLLGVERHELDEPQFQVALAGELAERHDFVFGDAADRDGVEPNLLEARSLRGGDAGQHAIEPGRRRSVETSLREARRG